MAVFPVQDDLIDAVLGFASAKLTDPKQVHKFFADRWRRVSIPTTLRTCRKIQGEVRDWLDDPEGAGLSAAWALIGYDLTDNKKRLDPGIAFGGTVLFRKRKKAKKGKKVDVTTKETEFHVLWDWWIDDATLRALCGLAVCTIWQANLKDRIGYCERDGCDNYFIDRRSRGERRRYCGTEECNKARSRARTAASRGKR